MKTEVIIWHQPKTSWTIISEIPQNHHTCHCVIPRKWKQFNDPCQVARLIFGKKLHPRKHPNTNMTMDNLPSESMHRTYDVPLPVVSLLKGNYWGPRSWEMSNQKKQQFSILQILYVVSAHYGHPIYTHYFQAMQDFFHQQWHVCEKRPTTKGPYMDT